MSMKSKSQPDELDRRPLEVRDLQSSLFELSRAQFAVGVLRAMRLLDVSWVDLALKLDAAGSRCGDGDAESIRDLVLTGIGLTLYQMAEITDAVCCDLTVDTRPLGFLGTTAGCQPELI